jgi:hypothetical protein
VTDLTRTSIVNLALREIGTTRIDDFTQSTPEADIARDVWDQAVRNCLARHEWRFAMKGAQLNRATSTPPTRYDYIYTLPSDYVRLGSLSDVSKMEPPLMEFRILEDGVHTSALAVYAEYVYDAPVIGTWTPWFVNVLVCDLASLMASPLKSSAERERLEQLAMSRLRSGRSIDSQHGPSLPHRGGSWVSAARGARYR